MTPIQFLQWIFLFLLSKGEAKMYEKETVIALNGSKFYSDKTDSFTLFLAFASFLYR
jgi:hypothetical protein